MTGPTDNNYAQRVAKLDRSLNAAGERFCEARHELSNNCFDLQNAVDLLLPLPAPRDFAKFGRLLAHAERCMADVRAAHERLAVRHAQIIQLAEVAARYQK